ncbi:nucleoside hydrolase [Scopulibacillus cellulosilyticus]|uniref:Nucleoside hydrolase n=1 Tax=Scopulibacillus cellulosilyticus TaxID=2665665 RepID=A0ABW2PU46_9BACL
MAKKLLLFTDPGIDDSFAIIYALLHPDIDLAGLVIDYGNVSQKEALANAAYLLKLANKEDIPLIEGAKCPMTGNLPQYAHDIHGTEGIGPIKTNHIQPKRVYPFQKIYELISEYGKELSIINTSPLTSLAFTYLYSASNIKQINETLIMGGAFLFPGNVSLVAEANIYSDPQAAKIVSTYGDSLTFLPLNITYHAIIPRKMIHQIANQNKNPFASIMKPAMDFYSDKYKHIIPGITGAPLHDVSILSYFTNPELFKGTKRQVFIVSDGIAKGQSIADFRPEPKVKSGHPVHRILLKFNYQGFLNNFYKVMLNSMH